MGDSRISWTDATWNPVTGCSKVSPGCTHCYAETLALGRLKGKRGYPGLPWTARNAPTNVVLHPDKLDQPLRWRKPRRVFVNSMSDLFHEQVPDEFIDQVFAVMALAPQHIFQILTKRPERMHEYMTKPVQGSWAGRFHVDGKPGTDVHWRIGYAGALIDAMQAAPPEALNRASDWQEKHRPDADGFMPIWPLPNVWLGVSVEDQERADERIPLLLHTPAEVRFISAEPLLGPVNLCGLGLCCTEHLSATLDWVIVGGESGPQARPLDHAWVRSLREQCREAGVAYWGKQDSGPRAGIALPGDLGDREWPRC